MSPSLKSVQDAGIESVRSKSNPSTLQPSDFFESCDELRNEFARLISTNDPNRIAIVPSASYGLANAANNIEITAEDEIIVLEEQFPSNYYVWLERAKRVGAKIITIKASASGADRVAQWNKSILEAINSKTKVVAMAQVHWTDGSLFDLQQIGKKVHDVGGYLIVDGTQSVGAMPLNVMDIGADALISAGYKWLLGPYGIGLAYYNERFDSGNPIEYNWVTRRNSEDFAGLVNYEDEYQPGAQRYDAGERSSFINVAMQLAALKQINNWGTVNIQEYCGAIVAPYLPELSSMGFEIAPKGSRGNHLMGIRAKNAIDPKRVAEILKESHVSVSVRGSAIRLAVNLFNTDEDIRVFVECLKKAV